MTRAIPMGALLALAGVWVAPPTLPLAGQPAGIDGIARTLVSTFDQFDVIALGEAVRPRLLRPQGTGPSEAW
jgi:hypothetical protein